MSIRTLIKGMAAIIHRCANKGNNSITIVSAKPDLC